MISQIYPSPFRSINSSFSGTPSPSPHSTAPTLFSGGGVVQELQELQRRLLSTSLEAFSLLPCEEKWPSTSPSLRSIHHPISCTFIMFRFTCFTLLNIFPPSFFCSPFFLQNHSDMPNKIVIPTDQPHLQCLGPLGNPDPTNLINAETNRIPFRAENFSLDLWKDTFRS